MNASRAWQGILLSLLLSLCTSLNLHRTINPIQTSSIATRLGKYRICIQTQWIDTWYLPTILLVRAPRLKQWDHKPWLSDLGVCHWDTHRPEWPTGDPLFRDTPLDKVYECPDPLLSRDFFRWMANLLCERLKGFVGRVRALVRPSEVRTAWSAKNPSLAVDHWQYGRQISIFYSFLRPWRHKSKSLERLGLIIWALFTNANIRAVTRKVLLALKSQSANIYDSQESSST